MTSVHRSYQTLTETLQRQKQAVRVPKVSFRNVFAFEISPPYPWDLFVLHLQDCTFVAPVLSKHKQLYARSCCRKIYQTLGPRFFMRHSGPPPFKEGYRYFGIGSQIWMLSSNSLLACCSRSPAGLSFCERIAGNRMSSGVSIGSVSSGRLGQLVDSW